VTDSLGPGNLGKAMSSLDATSAAGPLGHRMPEPGDKAAPSGRLTALYEEYFDFVWRSLRRLGVPLDAVDDATQDVFMVVHRRLGDFEGRSSPKSWLFSIALHVAQHHRRALARRRRQELDEELVDLGELGQEERALVGEAARLVYRLLDSLDDDKRAVFVLVHFEQMPAREIARALGIPINTVYSRLRLARRDFDAALRRHDAREVMR
jgi:RNA polymerase sigma-70 factor (ECF subfamily)